MTESTNYQELAEKALLQEAQRSADALGADELNIIDPLELLYKFIFDPKSDFGEINKLWSLTYLSSSDKEELLRLARNVRIYDQEKFYTTIQERKLTGFQEVEVEVEGKLMLQLQPQFKTELKYKSAFHELMAKDLGRIQAICAAAGGEKGHLVRAFRTTGVEKHESVEDKTAPKSRWLPSRKNKEN